MKFTLAFFLLTLPFVVFAGMTKPEIIASSAKHVVYYDEATNVVGCENVESDEELVECLKKNVTLDDELSVENDTTILEGIYELVYHGRTPDCVLRTEVNAKKRKVTFDSDWDC